MKKTIAILILFLMVLCLGACENSAGQTEPSSAESSSAESSTEDVSAESNARNDTSMEAGITDITDNTDSMDASETQSEGTESPEVQETRVLVAYFSATNTTEGVAEHIANGLGADLYEIVPENPYTDADLNYNDNNSRTTIEMNDPNARPVISGSVENMEQYTTVFVGYPIWWGDAPRIVSTFMESYDFSSKTIVPFCTSGGSGIGSSASNLEQLTSGAIWLDGRRLNGSDSQDAVMEWVNSLGLDFGA